MFVISMVLAFRIIRIRLLVNAMRVSSDRLVIKVVLYDCFSAGTIEINRLNLSLLELDECASNPCLNNGTCTDLENGFLCRCPPEWNGTVCAEPKSRQKKRLSEESP